MALIQVFGKVPEFRDRLINLIINGKKASRCVLSSMVGMVSERQVVGFALISSHLTSLRVTSFKDVIFRRSFGISFGKVLGTLRWSSGLKDLHMVSILSQKKDVKPSTSDASDTGSTGFPQAL